MAEYGGEQYKKQEGHQTDEHVQNQLHSTTAGHGCKEGKGVVEKIKEKLPGGDHSAEQHTTPVITAAVGGAGGYNVGEEGHEKKELMDKIKDKLPGGDHGSEEHRTHDTATVGGGEHGNVGEEEHEKLMDQIKDTVARTG